MWIVDKWQSLFSRFLRHLWRQFLLPYSKETFLGWIIPEDADAWHLLVESAHVGHHGLMIPFR
jgi:hypothetical protein